jgi:hypothetical protein
VGCRSLISQNPAVVRNETKLTNLLKSRNVPQELISKYLTIIIGNVKDIQSVSQALFHPSFSTGVVDIIVSGIGGSPVFTPNPLRPTLDDPKICQDATSTILEALRSGLKSTMEKPLFIAVSTTGISDHGRDIPIALVPLYHWLLPVPHADKKRMENLLANEIKSAEPTIRGFVAVRPSLLTDGDLLGVEKIRAGTESEGTVAKSAIGYTISRIDAGNWIYRMLVEDKDSRAKYVNQFVSITY